ncbi:unnamed protein product, partial [Effrenium voratum]
VYCLAPKGLREALRPKSQPVATVEAQSVFLRKDVARLRTPLEWKRLGRQLREGEKPVRHLPVKGADTNEFAIVAPGALNKVKAPRALYGDWQTMPMEAKSKAMPRKAKAKAKAKPGLLKLPAPPRKRKLPQVRLKGFDAFVKSLRSFVQGRGCMPWDKSSDKEERSLASSILKAQKAYGKRTLVEDQASVLEGLEGWTWGEAGQREAEAPATPTDAAAGSNPPENNEDEAGAQWCQHVLKRLQRQLGQLAVAERRKALRQWQRAYHPDKP